MLDYPRGILTLRGMNSNDTIIALSTPPGRSAVAVIRVSGTRAKEALAALGVPCPAPRLATRARLTLDKTPIDDALVLFFSAPASYTGEDVIELHTHGSRAIIATLVETLSALPGFRLAEPGEFTRRAFINGKMDLTEAEGVADLIEAETEAQRKQALALMGGAAKEFYESLRGRILMPLAHLEAFIDFPDEDIPADVVKKLTGDVMGLARDIEKTLADARRGERIREGVNVAIIGAPNAGKSSLMNALAGRDVAIVSHHAGTTRDIIEVSLNLGGYAVTLADTAGLRESADEIESEGVRRAKKHAADADIKIALFNSEILPLRDDTTDELVDARTISVASKSDLLHTDTGGLLKISTKTGQGIDTLLDVLKLKITTELSSAASPVITRARHRKALEAAFAHIAKFLKRMETPELNIELAAEELRLAASDIGRITGAIGVEDLLDAIFREFCIGK